jgi:DNA-binding NarL/FixJ family response regulator
MLDGDDSVFAAMRAGARGYLLKGADRNEIARALDGVAHGEVVFSAGIASRVLAFFAAGPGAAATALVPFPDLTEREREILDLVARGLTNAEIARRLVVSDKTVRNHVSNVFTKLQVAGRAEAVARARDAGLGAPG